MRYLALDWGTVRIGAAVSDPGGSIAFPLDHFIESASAITEIKKIVSEMDVGVILMGLPKAMSGNETSSTEQVKKFIADLQTQVEAKIEVVDERLSSVAAGKSLQEQGVKEKDQRSIKDNLAAQMMLQQYLSGLRNKK